MAAESILTSTKKLLGLTEEYKDFDVDIIMHINSAFATLNQLAVGPVNSLFITDDLADWADFIVGQPNINSVKSYVYFKVRLAFDPPATSFAITAMENMAKELEFRLNVVMENILRPPFYDVDAQSAQVVVWDLTGGIDFPPEAPIGAHGMDFNTNEVWIKV